MFFIRKTCLARKHRNDKAEALTIKKLTRNNPTMKAKFEEAREAQRIGISGEE